MQAVAFVLLVAAVVWTFVAVVRYPWREKRRPPC